VVCRSWQRIKRGLDDRRQKPIVCPTSDSTRIVGESWQGPVSLAGFGSKVRAVFHCDLNGVIFSGLAALGSKLKMYWRWTSSPTS
jgi:hypothetical protein